MGPSPAHTPSRSLPSRRSRRWAVAEVVLPEVAGGRLHLYVFFQSEDGERFPESRYFMVNL